MLGFAEIDFLAGSWIFPTNNVLARASELNAGVEVREREKLP